MGRKRELTSELIDRMAYLRGIGTPIPDMCRTVGIGVSVYYRWLREAEEWERLKELRELGFFDPENEAAVLAAIEANERERGGCAWCSELCPGEDVPAQANRFCSEAHERAFHQARAVA